jgi:hypothetical protein
VQRTYGAIELNLMNFTSAILLNHYLSECDVAQKLQYPCTTDISWYHAEHAVQLFLLISHKYTVTSVVYQKHSYTEITGHGICRCPFQLMNRTKMSNQQDIKQDMISAACVPDSLPKWLKINAKTERNNTSHLLNLSFCK